MTGWVITCYQAVVEHHDDLDAAKVAAEQHIRTCPEGAMPWAEHIEWHLTEYDAWVSAANGEWLNHHVWPEDS